MGKPSSQSEARQQMGVEGSDANARYLFLRSTSLVPRTRNYLQNPVGTKTVIRQKILVIKTYYDVNCTVGGPEVTSRASA